jgi:hypothetical protein
MHTMREKTDQPINRKMEGLHLKYINLAKDAQDRGDQVLSESYYQRAEYYLHAMNASGDCVLTLAAHCPSVSGSVAIKKVIKNLNLKKVLDEMPSSQQSNTLTGKPGSSQGRKILSSRVSFLRRNRRGIQHT